MNRILTIAITLVCVALLIYAIFVALKGGENIVTVSGSVEKDVLSVAITGEFTTASEISLFFDVGEDLQYEGLAQHSEDGVIRQITLENGNVRIRFATRGLLPAELAVLQFRMRDPEQTSDVKTTIESAFDAEGNAVSAGHR